MIRAIFYLIIIFSLVCCQFNTNTVEDWDYVFDISFTYGWRSYNGDSMLPGWKIINNVLTFNTTQILEEGYDYKGSREIIYGAEAF